MNQEFELSEPRLVWNYFLELSRIPRASGHTMALQEWLLNFAAERGLEAKRDAVGNVLISKSGTKGKENVPAVVLQSHMDMVCEKNADSTHDFEKDPIIPYIDGEWLKAKGTTLGADNGIGMAAQLALLSSDDLQHGPVECLFTVDEETGLNGAFGLEKGFFKANRLINLDSEDEGELFIGCAGGMNSKFTFKFKQEKAPDTYFYFMVTLKGLTGGHSGDDIDKGRGNANHLLARFLWHEKQATDLRLCDFHGGNLSNAIPREAVCMAGVPWNEKESVRVRLNCFVSDLEDEFGPIEPSLTVLLESVPVPEKAILKVDSDRFINAMYGCPIGIQAMSHSLPGLVETSLNLASVKPINENEWVVTTSQRSSVESAKHALSNRLEAVFSLAGMTTWHGEGYPGWKPNPNSKILKEVKSIYEELFGEAPKVRAIHAGLECGLFLEKYPALDMVSFGPTMRGVHSPDERLHIPAVTNFWKLLVETLARI
ncbi:MAG TPA: aminoacyl-histidine dipeptidase [Bacteroidales bacterium]|nr:aminoacyl-histidine dipeptidase [Bacteroidales bacterium]